MAESGALDFGPRAVAIVDFLDRCVPAARVALLPGLVLVAALGITWLVWDHERQASRTALRTQFEFSLREAVGRVEQRVSANEQLLRGVKGLFATTGIMDRDAVREYAASLRHEANFSGIQAIGVVEHVQGARKEAQIARMRRLGLPEYAIRPGGLRESHAPVIQLESYVERTRTGPGFDAWTDPVRRLAMELARDSGAAAISGIVRMMVDAEAGATPGYIMYLPIYAHGAPHDDIVGRRASLVGWVFASFRMNELVASLDGEQQSGLVFAIHDGAEPTDAALLYRSAETAEGRRQGAIAANEHLVLAGHTWTLSVSVSPDFEARYANDVAVLIALAGTGLSLLLALLAWLMATGRARTLRLAAEMTRELRDDIVERERTEGEVRQLAFHDSLTRLPNRRLLNDRLGHIMAASKRRGTWCALMFLDLDNFKALNDTHGHTVGDLLLIEAAERVKRCLREVDTVARFGGDEFVVIVGDLAGGKGDSAARAGIVAEKIRVALAKPYRLGVESGAEPDSVIEHHCTASIGVALFIDHQGSQDDILKWADTAMYQSKEAGGNSIRFFDSQSPYRPETGVSPAFEIVAAASGEERKRISAPAASGSRAALVSAAANENPGWS